MMGPAWAEEQAAPWTLGGSWDIWLPAFPGLDRWGLWTLSVGCKTSGEGETRKQTLVLVPWRFGGFIWFRLEPRLLTEVYHPSIKKCNAGAYQITVQGTEIPTGHLISKKELQMHGPVFWPAGNPKRQFTRQQTNPADVSVAVKARRTQCNRRGEVHSSRAVKLKLKRSPSGLHKFMRLCWRQ